MSFKIENIFAYEVLDSRGNPTVACVAKISSGLLSKKFFSAKAIVPSGASTGEREALELRDCDAGRYLGKGVKKAVHFVNYVIAPALIDEAIDPSKQEKLDSFLIELDGTETKSKYGANAVLSVSLSIAKAMAKAKGLPFYQYVASLMGNANPSRFILPLPMVNVINGGAHADNTIDFQEFMFMPIGASSMHEAVRISAECFHSLQKCLKESGFNTNKGDEGGFAPDLKSAEEALDFMITAIEKAGYRPGVNKHGQVAIALDVAASELYDKERGVYIFKKMLRAGLMDEAEATKTTEQMIDYYADLIEKYPIISIEDPLDESDWDGFAAMNERLGRNIQIVGDDLFCTNPKITQEGVESKVANAVLVKMNQIGTITETLKTIQLARNAGWSCILSHRSGETEDTSIADLAVGTSSGQIKTGSTSRSERVAKYNRLLEIEIELTASNSVFYGLNSIFTLDFEAVDRFKTEEEKPNGMTEDDALGGGYDHDGFGDTPPAVSFVEDSEGEEMAEAPAEEQPLEGGEVAEGEQEDMDGENREETNDDELEAAKIEEEVPLPPSEEEV